VQMPEFRSFLDRESYYATLGHECCHATRHPARLNRDFGRKRYGDAGYAMEELVALSGQSAPGYGCGRGTCPGSEQEGPARVAKCPRERRSGARGRSLFAHLGKSGVGVRGRGCTLPTSRW
jgi:hypothetical protein